MDLNMFSSLSRLRHERSRSINWENRTGEKGAACTAPGALGRSRKGSPCIEKIAPGETVTLADIRGPGEIRHIWATVTETTPRGRFVLRDLILRIYWDDEEAPSVECPLGDFFLNGFARGYAVNSLLVCVNPKNGMNAYFPMPFRRRARITMENQHAGEIPSFFYQIDYCLCDSVPEEALYFHAHWRRQSLTQRAQDYVLLRDVRGRGHYLGTFLAISTLERYWWGEGEFKFYIDGDREYPTVCSTGTEDYFGGAWSFGRREDRSGRPMEEETFSALFSGYPFYAREDNFDNAFFNRDCPPMRSLYRWHVMDPIVFAKDLRVELQQIGMNDRKEFFERCDDVSSVVYWYQEEPHTPFPPLPACSERWPR